jgi:uncharacterized protein (DUF58 family)
VHVTQRGWLEVALVGSLAAGAVVLARPLLLVGASMIGAWLIARQYTFVRSLSAVLEEFSIEQSIDREVVTSDESDLTLTASLAHPTSSTIEISAGVPSTASSSGGTTVTLPSGKEEASTDATVQWSVAGTFEFEPATVVISSECGRFYERFELGNTPSVTVEPGGLDDVHIGKGGEELTTAYGEHALSPLGTGLEPAELREYMPGDAARQIAWKATARQGTPFVREFETETDREAVLVFDHRSSMGTGEPGETKLDYARHVALSIVDYARSRDEPVGLYGISDDGLTTRLPPSAKRSRYADVRRRLHDLELPTSGERTAQRRVGTHRRTGSHLAPDGSPFTERLRPFLEDRMSYIERIERDPLYSTVRTYVQRLQGSLVTIIVTDDTNRSELREAALLARRNSDRVLVVIAPTVLFEESGLLDIDATYDWYVDFEEFRRSLEQLDRVSALEVAPGDRLSTILAESRRSPRSKASAQT